MEGRMKGISIVTAVLALAALCFAFDEPGKLVARWPIKTSLPTASGLRVHKHVTLDKLIHLDAPPQYVRKDSRDTRIAGKVEGLAVAQMVQVDGYPHMLARDDDGD